MCVYQAVKSTDYPCKTYRVNLPCTRTRIVRKLIDISCKLTDTVYFKLLCVDPLHSCGAVARAVAARSVRAATEGTLRWDFSKGQAWLDFSKGLRRDFRINRVFI